MASRQYCPPVTRCHRRGRAENCRTGRTFSAIISGGCDPSAPAGTRSVSLPGLLVASTAWATVADPWESVHEQDVQPEIRAARSRRGGDCCAVPGLGGGAGSEDAGDAAPGGAEAADRLLHVLRLPDEPVVPGAVARAADPRKLRRHADA